MIIEYKGSVNTPAGFRSVYIRANAEKISDKRVKVLLMIFQLVVISLSQVQKDKHLIVITPPKMK